MQINLDVTRDEANANLGYLPVCARLEIDEKFLGKEILCPDCQRPLPTKAPSTPPPLDLPDYRRTSGLAVLSLTLALVGAFIPPITIAAIVIGIFAIREIANKPTKLDGLGYARAGVVVGAVFTFLALAAFASPYVFSIDTILRYATLSSRVQFPEGNEIEGNAGVNRDNVSLTRQTPYWGKYLSPSNLSANVKGDDLILVNISEDAYIACQELIIDGGVDNEDDKLKKVLERFTQSELVDLVFRLKYKPLNEEPVVVENKLVQGNSKREVTVDLRNRRFLIQFNANNRDQLTLMVGAARRNRFDRMADEFRKTFDTKKL